MQLKLPGISFEDDSRGVSGVVGFIFIFAIIMILFSINQAQVVPQENREVEFQHFQEVRDDMVKVRSSISEAGQGNVSQFPTVTLGTTYSPRVFAVNPPQPSGILETSKPYNLWINQSGTSESVSTRFLVYRNGYNEMDIGPIRYEHSVLYLDERGNGGGIAIYEDQNIITGNNSARVTALQNDFRVTSTGEVTLDLYPTENPSISTEHMSGNVTLKIPTRLNGSAYWDGSIGSMASNGQWEYHGTEQYHSKDNLWWLNLTVKASSLNFNTVGIDSTPEGQGSARQGVGPGGGGVAEGNDSGSVGDGSVSNYSEDSSSDTFSSSNGRWEGITCTDQLLLSDGQPASRPNGDNLEGDVIRLSAWLTDSTGESYTIDIKLARATDGSWNEKEMIIHDENDNNVNAELTADAAARIYEGGETDMLELSNYDDPDTGSGSFSDFVERIRALEDDAPVVWQTTRMTGRVTVALECDPPPEPPASGVTAVDGTTPNSESSALLFDIQVASGTTKTVTDIEITTPGNQNDDVQDAKQLKRSGQNEEARLTASNTYGVNQSGGLKDNIKLPGTKHELDTNAVFSNGAVLSVDMGEIEGGSTKWTYLLVDSQSNADVVVTFYFNDGTQFQAYLRVTNVNS